MPRCLSLQFWELVVGGGPAQVFPPKRFFGRETTFSEAQKTPKKQTDAEQPFFDQALFD